MIPRHSFVHWRAGTPHMHSRALGFEISSDKVANANIRSCVRNFSTSAPYARTSGEHALLPSPENAIQTTIF